MSRRRIQVECPKRCGSIRWASGPTDAERLRGIQCWACYLTWRRENPRRATPDDVDEMAVEALLAGRTVRTNAAERQAAVAYLTDHREPAWVIAERLRIHKRSVERLRQRIRETA